MRILLVDLDSPTRALLQSTLHEHTIGIGNTQNAATILRALASSSQPIVTICACRPSAWWDSADLLNMIADNSTLATGHHFIVLANLHDTMPPTLSRAIARLPIQLVTNGADLGAVVANLVRDMSDGTSQQRATSEPLPFEQNNISWAYA